MKNIFTSFLVLISLISYSQVSYQVEGLETKPCLSDPSVMVTLPTNIEIYQTEDDLPFGPKDDSQCITVRKDGGKHWVNLSEIDLEKHIFFRHKVYENFMDYPVIPNILYNINGNFIGNPSYIDFSSSCDNNEQCSKIILGFTIPNEAMTGLSDIYYDLPFNSNCDITTCLPTQHFESGQFIKDVIFQLKLNDQADQNGEMIFPSYFMEAFDFGNQVITEDIEVSESYYDGDSTYYTNIMALLNNYYVPIIFGFNNAGYPSETNRSYIEFYPEINKDTPQNIIVENYNEISVHFQNYTTIRAGLIEGSSDERHNLDFQFNSDVCLFSVELIGDSGTTLTMKAGSSISLAGKTSCIQLRENAAMVIDEKHTINYGLNGIGMLALKDNSRIVLNEGAELFFDGRLILDDYDNDLSNDKANIKLEKGSKLIFSEFAKIISHDHHVRTLDIYMNGGTIDLSKLDSKYQAKVRLIYPEIKSTNFNVFPNPSYDYIQLPITYKKDQPYYIMNMDGQEVQQGILSQNNQKIWTPDLPKGIFSIMIFENNRQILGRFIKI